MHTCVYIRSQRQYIITVDPRKSAARARLSLALIFLPCWLLQSMFKEAWLYVNYKETLHIYTFYFFNSRRGISSFDIYHE